MAVRILIVLAVVAALVVIALATGLVNGDKAPSGSRGRVPVTTTSP